MKTTSRQVPKPRSTADENARRTRGTLPKDQGTAGRMVNDRVVAEKAKPHGNVVAVSDAGVPLPKYPQKPATSLAGPNDESYMLGTTPNLVFDPDKSPKVKICSRIVHVQATRMNVDDVVVRPYEYFPMTGGWRRNYVTNAGWYLDIHFGDPTPDYQQKDPKQYGAPGKKLSKREGGSTKATMSDVVETLGPAKGSKWNGFYDPVGNPIGCKKVVYEYETFAWCMDGVDCGKWYEGVRWTFTKTWEDHLKGKPGTSVFENKRLEKPSEEFLAAFKAFNLVTGFVPCQGNGAFPKKG